MVEPVESGPWCTCCDRPEQESGKLVTGPWLTFKGSDLGVHLCVCGDCVGKLEELFAMQVDRDGKVGPDTPTCSYCDQGAAASVGAMALVARFYRLVVDGEARIERVVHHALFMAAHGSRDPELVAEVHICDACTALAREVLDER